MEWIKVRRCQGGKGEAKAYLSHADIHDTGLGQGNGGQGDEQKKRESLVPFPS